MRPLRKTLREASKDKFSTPTLTCLKPITLNRLQVPNITPVHKDIQALNSTKLILKQFTNKELLEVSNNSSKEDKLESNQDKEHKLNHSSHRKLKETLHNSQEILSNPLETSLERSSKEQAKQQPEQPTSKTQLLHSQPQAKPKYSQETW